MKRLVMIFGPVIVVISVLSFAKPRGIGGPAWVRWVVASLCFLIPIATALVMRRPRRAPAAVEAPAFLRERMQKILKLRLFIYIYTLIAGTVMVVMLRNVIPLRFSVLAVVVNVVLISLICRDLLWTHPGSKDK